MVSHIAESNHPRGLFRLSAFGIALSLFSLIGPSGAQSITYFPASEFRDLPSWDKDEPRSWSEALTLFREPSVAAAGDRGFTMRITVLPAFSNSTVVRITENGSGEVSGLSKQLWVHLTGPLVEIPVSATRSELASLKHTLKNGHFWALTNQNSNIVQSDGFDLLLEVNDHGRYHAVISSGYQHQSVLRVARMMLNLARLHLPGE